MAAPGQRLMGKKQMFGKRNNFYHVWFGLAVGLSTAVLAWYTFTRWRLGAGDFTWSWRAAQALLAYQNPYDVIQPTGDYPYDAPFYYPLPAALVALPFAALPATSAGAVFVGVSAGILAWALCKDTPVRLLMLVSAPFFMALRSGQWSPLLTAALLLPALAPLAVVKPNLGLAIVAQHIHKRMVFGCGLLIVLSLVILPSWPLNWLVALQANRHMAPVLTFPGWLVLFALLRWRDPWARVVVALAVLPQRLLFYDQLPLLLVARTPREQLLLLVSGWLGFLGWQVMAGPNVDAAPAWVLWFCYVPALLVVLKPLVLERTQLVVAKAGAE